MRLIIAFSCALVTVILVAGCSRDEEDSAGFTSADSAGITIATNSASLADLRPVLTVAAEPRRRIGAVDGAQEMLFSGVRGAVRLPGDRIAVANGQPIEIRIFGPDGTLVGTMGKRGQGPGEFRQLAALMLGDGDTLLAVNVPQFQLVRFSASSGYIDMHTASRDSMAAHHPGFLPTEGPREYFRNGSFVVATLADSNYSEEVAFPTGKLVWPKSTLVWFDRDYEPSRVVGEIGGIEQIFIDVGGGRRTAVVPPGARRGVRSLGGRGTRLCFAGEGFEVRCVDEDGTQVVVRWTQDAVATPQAEIDAWKTRISTGDLGEPGVTPERVIAGTVIPQSRPPISTILVATDKRIFVAGPDLKRERQGWAPYRVFSPTGELLGVAELPMMTAFEIGEDYILGVSRNADGVEFVVMHDIKPM